MGNLRKKIGTLAIIVPLSISAYTGIGMRNVYAGVGGIRHLDNFDYSDVEWKYGESDFVPIEEEDCSESKLEIEIDKTDEKLVDTNNHEVE